MSAPVLSWQRRAADSGLRKSWATEPSEETRQHYANQRIQEFQRLYPGEDFALVLAAFRSYGELYDRGYRLRDKESAA